MKSMYYWARDRYTVWIPSDCESEPIRRWNLAVIQAKERARLYVTPCTWLYISDDGTNVKLCRLRRKRLPYCNWNCREAYLSDRELGMIYPPTPKGQCRYCLKVLNES